MKKLLNIICLSLFIASYLNGNGQTTTFDNLNANPLTSKAITWTSSNYGSGFGHRIINSDPGGQTLLNFQARHNTATWSNLLTLTTLGRVGIGTTTPSHLFSLGNNSNTTNLFKVDGIHSDVLFNGTHTTGNIWSFINTGTGPGTRLYVEDANNSSSRLTFDFKGNGGVTNILAGTSSGNVGIGTTSPDSKLTVKGHVNIGGDGNYHLKTRHIDGKSFENTSIDNLYLNYGVGKKVYVGSFSTGSLSTDLLVSGNLGIGTSAPDSKLTVKGNIHSNEVKVDLLGAIAPDYVFYKDYNLKTLQEVEDYILEHGHLSNIPSAKKMEEEGISLKEMNLKLLEKIEELTLYAIAQEKRIETLEQENETLKSQDDRIALLEEKIELLLTKKQ